MRPCASANCRLKPQAIDGSTSPVLAINLFQHSNRYLYCVTFWCMHVKLQGSIRRCKAQNMWHPAQPSLFMIW